MRLGATMTTAFGLLGVAVKVVAAAGRDQCDTAVRTAQQVSGGEPVGTTAHHGSWVEGIDDAALAVMVIGCVCTAALVFRLLSPVLASFQPGGGAGAGAGGGAGHDAVAAGNVEPVRQRPHGSCPICLGTPVHPVWPTCEHSLCGGCFQQLFSRSPRAQVIRCPVCRQLMRAVLGGSSNHPPELRAAVRSYNRQHAGLPVGFFERLRDTPALVRDAISSMFARGNGLNLLVRARMLQSLVSMVVYLVLPMDLVPEAVYGVFGYLDDLVVALLLLSLIARMWRAELQV